MGCSIHFTRRIKGRRTIDGASVEIVVAAEIDHVALVTDAAYRGTRVWRADCDLTDAPWTVQVLAAKWERGRARALAEAARPPARRFGSAPTFSPADMLRFAAVRAETFRRPISADGHVFAHVAFTRAAGFAG